MDTAMFKNREIRIRLAKTPKNETPLDEDLAAFIGKSSAIVFHDLAVDTLKIAAIVIGGTVIACKIVSAGCDIAVKSTETK